MGRLIYGCTEKDEINTNCRVIRCSDDGFLVNTHKDITTQLINLYLYKTEATPTLTSSVSVGDTVIDIDDNAGITNGRAITFYENTNFHQSIVKSTTAPPGATLTMQSPSDKSFTTGATVEIGNWNLNANGSLGSPVIYSVGPPSGLYFHITSIGININDNVAMDSGKFGGITALTNGIVLQRDNTVLENLLLAVNNIGFAEQGYDTIYDDKAPAGTYGVRHRFDVIARVGNAIELDGSSSDVIKVIVQDNLSAITQMTCTILGHVCPECEL
jgi:hypothetical protein